MYKPIIIGIALCLTILSSFFAYGLKISNTGALLIRKYPKKYINIRPPRDIMKVIGSNKLVPVTDSKNIVVNGKQINISYNITEKIQLLEKISKTIDSLLLIEYAIRSVINVLYGNSNAVYKNVKIEFKQRVSKEDTYAGASVNYSGSDYNTIIYNFEFIEKIYAETDSYEFLIYYIGLIIHELVHHFIQVNPVDEDHIRISENIAEYIRMSLGYLNPNFYLYKSNKILPTEHYGTEGAYFMYWLNTSYPGILNELINFVMTNNITLEQVLYNYTKKTHKELFAEFNKILP